MNGYERAKNTEAEGMVVLTPFLHQNSDGHFVLMKGGPLAKALQQSDGDAIMTVNHGVYSVEVKIERDHTGNLFLESWSNRNLESLENHVRMGGNPGWMYKLKSMLLFYYA